MNTRVLAVALTFAATASICTAQTIRFTNHCENNSSNSERDLVREAYEFVHRHQDLLWQEIDRGRAEEPSYGYTDVSETRRGRWEREIDEIRVNCETNGCDNDPGLLGRCTVSSWGGGVLNPSDRLQICLSNIQDLATDSRTQAQQRGCHSTEFAMIAGTIAHEVMHFCDGWEGHGSGGSTPWDPGTDAVTVGTAMEHIALTPDHSVRIASVTQKTSSGSPYLEIVAYIENENPHSGDLTTQALSGKWRNRDTEVALYLNDALVETKSLGKIVANDSKKVTFTYSESEGYSANRDYDIEVVADSTDRLWEYDEDDNTATMWFTPACDLAISSFEIAGPYSTHRSLSGSHRTLSYDLTVTNLSASNTSGDTVLQETVLHTGFGSGSETGFHSIPALGPGETHHLSIEVEVELSGWSGDVVTSWLFLTLDPEEDMHDGDRSNNAITLMIDEDYFRPDYTIGFNAIEWASSGVTVTCIAKNVGPENGSACFVRLTVNDVSAYQQLMSSLEVAQSTQLIFEPTDLSLSLLGAETELRLKVDHYDGVDENDETNNEALAWVSRGGSLDPVLQRFEWIGPSVAEPLRIDPMFLDEIERMLDLIDGYLVDPWVSRYPGGNGPIIELPEAWLVEVRTGERILVVLNQPLFTRAEKLFSTLVR